MMMMMMTDVNSMRLKTKRDKEQLTKQQLQKTKQKTKQNKQTNKRKKRRRRRRRRRKINLMTFQLINYSAL